MLNEKGNASIEKTFYGFSVLFQKINIKLTLARWNLRQLFIFLTYNCYSVCVKSLYCISLITYI